MSEQEVTVRGRDKAMWRAVPALAVLLSASLGPLAAEEPKLRLTLGGHAENTSNTRKGNLSHRPICQDFTASNG
jgi:hypothetical protein